MLLILEIWLTISAWRKGWKAWALLPLAACVGIGVVIGVMAAASGEAALGFAPGYLLGDLLCIAALAVLAARGPKHATELAADNAGGLAESQATPPQVSVITNDIVTV